MRVRTVVGAVGLVVTLLGIVLVLVPGAVLSIHPITLATASIPTEDPATLLLVIGFVVGLVATVVSRSTTGTDATPIVEHDPETVQTTGRPGPGRRFDRELDRPDGDVAAIEELLRSTAIETLVQQAGLDHEAARDAVERGRWTDDRIAAALVGHRSQPLLARLREWLDPVAERERRVRRTVEAIEAIGEGRA